MGISPQYLSYILNGTRSGKRYIEAIARVLELDQKQVGKTTAAWTARGETGAGDIYHIGRSRPL